LSGVLRIIQEFEVFEVKIFEGISKNFRSFQEFFEFSDLG
jgi:hypothetical protein